MESYFLISIEITNKNMFTQAEVLTQPTLRPVSEFDVFNII